MFGYMTKEKAKKQGFTHNGSYYGVPVWIKNDPTDFHVAVKWAPLDLAFDFCALMEAIIRPMLFPGDPVCFQFQLKESIEDER